MGYILSQIPGGVCRQIFFDARCHGMPGLEQTEQTVVSTGMFSDKLGKLAGPGVVFI